MKILYSITRRAHLWSALLWLPLSLPLMGADNLVTYQSQPGSKVRIEGTSTIHDWTVESQLLGGTMQFDAQLPTNPAEGIKVTAPKVDVSIPVRSLKSGKSSMDDVMLNAMKQKEFPKINYKLKEMTLKDPPAKAGAPFKFNTKGELTVSGVTRTNDMIVTFQPMPGDKLKVTGAVNLKMTDFGITPPAPAIGLGLIKTGDEVKINFEWVTGRTK